MDESLDTVVDSGSSSEPSVSVPDPPSVPEPAPVDPLPEPMPAPEPAPVDPPSEPTPAPELAPVDPLPEPTPAPEPAPVDPPSEPTPAPEPVEPLPSDPVGPSPSDPVEDVVPPGSDSSPVDPSPVDPLPVDPPSSSDGFVSNLPGWLADRVYGQQTQQPVNSPVELILDNVETFQLSPIEDSTGLKGVLLRIIGPYDNIVTQYRYQQSNNQYYTYVNEVTPDYPWIASAALFIALLLSLFGLLKRGMSWMK